MDGAGLDMRVQTALAEWIADRACDPVSDPARRAACHAVLDWLGVTMAGAREPVVEILVRDALVNGEAGPAGLVGRTEQLSPAFAALANGTASHALDYDDVNVRMRGHPSVTVVPALLSIAATQGGSGRSLLDALVVGTEVACTVGEMVGPEHYERGFHATATVGTIAAVAGCAALLELDRAQTHHALGLAATQAAGLQASFGTMAKPLHAGKAAMNGLLSARWAAAGLTAGEHSVEGRQGFGPTQSATFRPRPIRPDPAAPFGIERNGYKVHAACYYTHSAIEAVRALVRDNDVSTGSIERIKVRLGAAQLAVCDIADPATGLEVKFSIRHVVAMALQGIDTGDIAQYCQAIARDETLGALRRRVRTEAADLESRTAAQVEIVLNDGTRISRTVDCGIPVTDAEVREESLMRKFATLVQPILGDGATTALAGEILTLAGQADVRPFLQSLTPESSDA